MVLKGNFAGWADSDAISNALYRPAAHANERQGCKNCPICPNSGRLREFPTPILDCEASSIWLYAIRRNTRRNTE